MTKNNRNRILENLVFVRIAQLFVNELYKKSQFKIPIHLALGHEAIAIAIDDSMEDEDRLLVTHRNIHYHLARLSVVKPVIEEYKLTNSGMSCGQQGSMNLTNSELKIPYASSILGNNFGVGVGVSLGLQINNSDGVTFIITGDGAIEEGSFYEALLMSVGKRLPIIIVVENNQWSLASKIEDRRSLINLELLAKSVGASYCNLDGNDVFDYAKKMNEIRSKASIEKSTYIVEAHVATLGDWVLKNDDFPEGKFVNYHAGPAKSLSLMNCPFIKQDSRDPIFVASKHYSLDLLEETSNQMKTRIESELE